jgi:hypothetical protein
MAPTKAELEKANKKLEKKSNPYIYISLFGFVFGMLYISGIIEAIITGLLGTDLKGETLTIGKYNFGTGSIIFIISLIFALIGNPKILNKLPFINKKK